jgi:hypothetical protein
MEIKSYNELSHYANIYSLSKFFGPSRSGCVISTAKNLYRLDCDQGGAIKLVVLSLKRITAETEIIGHEGMHWNELFIIAALLKTRNKTFTLNVYVTRNDDLEGDSKHSHEIELNFVPYRVHIVTAK